MQVVVDTDILINHLRKRATFFSQLARGVRQGRWELIFPSLVALELYQGRETRRRKELERVDRILKSGRIFDVNLEIAREAGFLLRDYQQLPDVVDAVVAAIALHEDAQVATHNRRHYEGIKGLKIFSAD